MALATKTATMIKMSQTSWSLEVWWTDQLLCFIYAML
jgi:hypothetical protein